MTIEAKRILDEGVYAPTMLYNAETWGTRLEESRRLHVFQIKCLRRIARVVRSNITNTDVFLIRTGMFRKLEDRVDLRVLRWFWLMVWVDDGTLVKRVMEAAVSGRRR